MACASSSARIQWMWYANVDPFSNSQPAGWKSYSDVENMIIEEAFQARQNHAILDNYSIDYKNKIQILDKNPSKQSPIRRVVDNRANQYLREERFTFTPINPERRFAGVYGVFIS